MVKCLHSGDPYMIPKQADLQVSDFQGATLAIAKTGQKLITYLPSFELALLVFILDVLHFMWRVYFFVFEYSALDHAHKHLCSN